MNDPLFIYLFVMSLLCFTSIAVVLWAIKRFNEDNVIEDPLAQTLEELEAMYEKEWV